MPDINISDAFGFGKGMEKLLEVISKGVGRVTKAHFTVKDAEAKAIELRKIAEAEAHNIRVVANAIKETQEGTELIEYNKEGLRVHSITGLPSFEQLSLEERVQKRILYQQAKKELNIEAVTAAAAKQLAEENEISDEAVDEDWIARFFNIAEDVSNEEMQLLWSKVLAGEVKQPKSYSLRTLELLRNLTGDEARTIMRVGNFAIKSLDTLFLLRGHRNDTLKPFGIPYEDISLLIELGIIHPNEESILTLHKSRLFAQADFYFGRHILSAMRNEGAPNYTLPIYSFTKPGREILKLIEIDPPFEYVNQLARLLTDAAVKLLYSEMLTDNGKTFQTRYKNFSDMYGAW